MGQFYWISQDYSIIFFDNSFTIQTEQKPFLGAALRLPAVSGSVKKIKPEQAGGIFLLCSARGRTRCEMVRAPCLCLRLCSSSVQTHMGLLSTSAGAARARQEEQMLTQDQLHVFPDPVMPQVHPCQGWALPTPPPSLQHSSLWLFSQNPGQNRWSELV